MSFKQLIAELKIYKYPEGEGDPGWIAQYFDKLDKLTEQEVLTFLESYKDKRHIEMFKRRYGLDGYTGTTFKKIGTVYNLTGARIRFVVVTYFRHLRSWVAHGIPKTIQGGIFTIYWDNGDREVLEGDTVEDAIAKQNERRRHWFRRTATVSWWEYGDTNNFMFDIKGHAWQCVRPIMLPEGHKPNLKTLKAMGDSLISIIGEEKKHGT